MRKFFNLLGKNRAGFITALGVGITFSALGVLNPTISGWVISAFTSGDGDKSRLMALFLAASALQILFFVLDRRATETLVIRQKALMRGEAFRAFCPRDDATREDVSSFVSFVNNDVPSIADMYFLGVIDIVKCTSIIIMSAASLLYIHWLLALIIVGISVLIVLVPTSMRKKSSAARQSFSASQANYNTVLGSVLNGLRVVNTYNARGYGEDSVASADAATVRAERRLLSRQIGVQFSSAVLQVVETVSVLTIGAVFVARGTIDVGDLVAAVQLAAIIGSPIEVLAYRRHQLNEAAPLVARYEKLLASQKADAGDAAEELRELSVKNLSYEADGLQILKNVSASFEAGKKYLIVGESGSEKSTLLRLLARIGEDGRGGNIEYNGRDIRSIERSSYYAKICPVFQEPYLFHATLRENICLGRDFTEDDYRAVIKSLKLEYLLDRIGDDELTPELIETLSGGERQRVCLARAMIRAPEMYLLDEVTSALDEINSKLVEELLLKTPAAVIHVCHKPNPELSEQYDKHLKMENGRLTEL